MHVWKSILVVLFLIAITAVLAFLIFRCVRLHKNKKLKISSVVLTLIAGLLTLTMYSSLWEYTYPFEQEVDLQLYETIEIPTEHTLHGPKSFNWHASYEEWGLLFPESLYYFPEKTEDDLGFCWPEMDYEHYTYIISYGQKMESLSYNVWEIVRYPHVTGAKVGHAVLSDEFNPNAVYIYQIKKMRIDNDS